MNIKKRNIKFIMYLISAIFYGGFNIVFPLYIVFFIDAINTLLNFLSNKKINILNRLSVRLILFSCILPSNEIIIVVTIFIFAINLIYNSLNHRKNNVHIITLFSLLYIIFNIVINKVPLINIILFFIFNFTFIYYYYFFGKLINSEEIIQVIISSFKEILIIQSVSILSKLIFDFGEVIKFRDLDWVSGTFGKFQQNILMNICVFMTIVFFVSYIKTKKKLFKIYSILSALIALSTGSIANTIILFFIVFFTFIVSPKIKIKNKIWIVILLTIGIIFFIKINPEWVIKDIINFQNKQYIEERVPKLKTYNDVFYDISKNNERLFWFGVGVGRFSSRAALTATGHYIEAYSKVFKPSVSEYTYKYVYNKMLIFTNGGVLTAPYSSIISIQGELGIIGLFSISIFLLRLLRKNTYNNIIILYFFGILFIENNIEFVKIVVFLWSSYFFVLNIHNKKE